jgi:hypothetical protein
MTWCETKDGFVNLATARSIRMSDTGNTVIYDADGKPHTVWGFDEEEILGVVLPAAGNQWLHHFWYWWPDGAPEPEIGEEVYPDYRLASVRRLFQANCPRQ